MAENFTGSQKKTEAKNKKSFSEKFTIRIITQNSIFAAVYVALTLVLPILSFGPIQCRFSEALVLLCFWRPDFIVGLTIGCLISNTVGCAIGVASAWDILIGTSATLISCLLISYFSKRLLIAVIWPVIFNAVIVGSELYFMGFAGELIIWFSIAYVGIGELIAVAAGYALWMVLSRMSFFKKVIQPTLHNDIKW